LSKLKGKKIIPVKKPDGEICCMDYNKDIWYLPDRQNLLNSFSGRLLLINFEAKTVRKLKPLVEAMGFQNYLLSAADDSTTVTVGVKVFNQPRTLELRRRVQYFSP
jgi:hypothetical protein